MNRQLEIDPPADWLIAAQLKYKPRKGLRKKLRKKLEKIIVPKAVLPEREP